MVDRLIVSILQWMSQKKQCLKMLVTTPLRREKKDLFIPLRLELLTKAHGLEASEMALASRYGQMGPDMKVNSKFNEFRVMEGQQSSWSR